MPDWRPVPILWSRTSARSSPTTRRYAGGNVDMLDLIEDFGLITAF